MRPIAADTMDLEGAPLSPGMQHDDRIYVSGQVPIDPDTGAVVGDDIGEQTPQALANVRRVLDAGDASLSDVLILPAIVA